MIPLLIIISLISFAILQLMPGDYLTRSRLNPDITQETFDEMAHRYGLDKPFIVQWWIWFTRIIRYGDFGTSFETRQPVFFTLFMGGGYSGR